MDQRNYRKRQLHAQDHLAQNQKPVGAMLAGQVNGEGRRDDRHGPRHQPPQPGPHPEIEESFHYNLAGHGASQRRGLARTQKRDAEQHACHGGA